MKRTGHIYERMQDWDAIKEAERVATKCKPKNYGVRLHSERSIRNLVEIQEMVIGHRMRTGRYKHEVVRSSQGKVRDIAKLDFHPSHIQHQLLVLAGQTEIDNHLIKDTYASRKGYGQHKCAERLWYWVRKHSELKWYLQIDVRKYYEHIRHDLIREQLERIFKDKQYIDAYVETIEKFSDGVAIPLGIRPSQVFGNLALLPLDRLVKEDLRVKYYIRYLDDAVALFETKADCWRLWDKIQPFLRKVGFECHEPIVRRIEYGIDFMGYVTYPGRGQFIRKRNKTAWLKRRHKITNKRRLREIDSSFWGMVSHGNMHCKRLYKKMGGVSFGALGIKRSEPTDKDGKRVIDAPSVSMQMVLGKEVVVKDMITGVTTKHGGDRMVLLVEVLGGDNKLIVNAAPIKQFIEDCWSKGVTKMAVVFIEKSYMHYDIDYSHANVLEVHGRAIYTDAEGRVRYTDTGDIVQL